MLVTGDDVKRSVMPRLKVVGADMTRIDHLPRPGDRLPTDTDFGAIFGAVRAADARFVVLDHLLPIVSPSAASCTDEDVGSALARLARLAARTRTAVLVTRDLYGGKEDQRIEGIRNISGVWTRLIAGPAPQDGQRSVLRRITSDPSTTSVASLQFAMVVDADGVPSIAWSRAPHAAESSGRDGPPLPWRPTSCGSGWPTAPCPWRRSPRPRLLAHRTMQSTDPVPRFRRTSRGSRDRP